jgi:hypothetical protein
MTTQRGRDDQDRLMPPPSGRNAGNPSDFCTRAKPANDNLERTWPAARTVPNASQTSTSVEKLRRAFRRNTVLVAYGIVTGVAMIAWFYLIGLTLLTAFEWALG